MGSSDPARIQIRCMSCMRAVTNAHAIIDMHMPARTRSLNHFHLTAPPTQPHPNTHTEYTPGQEASTRRKSARQWDAAPLLLLCLRVSTANAFWRSWKDACWHTFSTVSLLRLYGANIMRARLFCEFVPGTMLPLPCHMPEANAWPCMPLPPAFPCELEMDRASVRTTQTHTLPPTFPAHARRRR